MNRNNRPEAATRRAPQAPGAFRLPAGPFPASARRHAPNPKDLQFP